MKKEIKEGELIPKGYGIAYSDIDRSVAVIYPIPFNLIIGSLRKLWIWAMYGHKLYEDSMTKGYDKGFNEGRDYAFNQYKQMALRQGLEDIINNFFTYAEKVQRLPEWKQAGWIREFIRQETERLSSSHLRALEERKR